MKIVSKLTAMSLVLVLTACSGGVKPNTQPDWISGSARQYPSGQYLTGRGSSARLDDASDRARADLAKIFEVEISEASQDLQEYQQESDDEGQSSNTSLKVTRDIEVRTGRVLHGVEIAESWRDPDNGMFYALAVLKRQPAAQVLRDEINRRDDEAQRYIADARREQDMLDRIAAASKAVDTQVERAYLQRTLGIIVPGDRTVPRWPLARLRADRDALLQQLVFGTAASGNHADDLAPLLTSAIAQAGFGVQADRSPQYWLEATLDLDDPVYRDGWYWIRGTLGLTLLNPDKTVRGVKRWPIKSSAQKSDASFRRMLDQVDTILKKDLRSTVISFAGDT